MLTLRKPHISLLGPSRVPHLNLVTRFASRNGSRTSPSTHHVSASHNCPSSNLIPHKSRLPTVDWRKSEHFISTPTLGYFRGPRTKRAKKSTEEKTTKHDNKFKICKEARIVTESAEKNEGDNVKKKENPNKTSPKP